MIGLRAAVTCALLLAPAFAASSAELVASSAVAEDDAVLRAHPVVYELHDVRQPRCDAPDVKEGELARTIVQVRSRAPFPDVDKQLRYFGRPEFTIERILMRIPRSITWPTMTARDREAAAATLAALRHHEIGHVRIAIDEVERLNAAPFTVTPDPEVYRRTIVQRTKDGIEALAHAQAAYDALTDHGRRQDRASGVFHGARTELDCPPPNGAAPDQRARYRLRNSSSTTASKITTPSTMSCVYDSTCSRFITL